MSTFTTGLCKIEKNCNSWMEIPQIKGSKQRGVYKNQKESYWNFPLFFILWIRKSRNGKFKITYIYFEFFFTVVLNSIFILTYPGSKVNNRFTHDYHCTLFHFQIALYSARKQICYKFVGTAGTYNRTQRFF